MSNNSATATSAGFGVGTILWILAATLVLLKVLHVIAISWFWAVFPAILSVALAVAIFAVVILGIIVLAIIQALVD